MLSCYIIDDEQMAIDILQLYVSRTPGLHLAGTSLNPIEGLDYLQKNPVSFLFLDINMEELGGMDLMKMIKHKVILTTASEEHALPAYAYENTVDYLLKPIDYERFLMGVRKMMSILTPGPIIPDTPRERTDIVTFKTPDGIFKASWDSIDYIEAHRYNSYVYQGTRKTLVTPAIKEIEAMLPTSIFTRVHKSFIINTTKIKDRRFDRAILQSEYVVPIGRAYR